MRRGAIRRFCRAAICRSKPYWLVPSWWPFAPTSRGARIACMNASNRTVRTNEFGQPIGHDLPGWSPPPFPPHVALEGRYCRVEPLDAARHGPQLWEAQREDPHGQRWTYLFHGPYADFASYEKWLKEAQASRDPQFYAVIDADGRACGTCTYMRIEPRHGVIEIGNIYLAPRLARTR